MPKGLSKNLQLISGWVFSKKGPFESILTGKFPDLRFPRGCIAWRMAIENTNKLGQEIQKSREELAALQHRIKSLVNRRAESPKPEKKKTVKIPMSSTVRKVP